MYDKTPEQTYNVAQQTGAALGAPIGRHGIINPTLRENIDAKVQYHKYEILRLEAIKSKLPQLLDVNLRDLREAMNF